MDMFDHASNETIVGMATLKVRAKNEKDIEGRKSLILSYIKAHEGEEISLQAIADVAGYAATGSAHVALKGLTTSGRIRKQPLKNRGRGHHYTYYIQDLSARTGNHNGPALTNRFEPEQEKRREVSKARQWAEELDRRIWPYLKDSTADAEELGNMTKTLRDFSKAAWDTLEASEDQAGGGQ